MDENLSKNKISERKQKRREMLAGYFFDLSKLMCSGVVVGGLSPLFTGDEMGILIICALVLVSRQRYYLLILVTKFLR